MINLDMTEVNIVEPQKPVGMKETLIKTQIPEVKPYEGERFRIFDAWRSTVGFIYDKKRALIDKDYAKPEEMRKEPELMGKSEDEIIALALQREQEVKDLTDENKVEPEELKRRKELQTAFETVYEIDKAIAEETKTQIAQKAAELKKSNPDATLTSEQIKQINLQAEFTYHNKPGAISDSETFAPIISELKAIAESPLKEGEAATPEMTEAKRLVNELNYDATDNKFLAKTEKQVGEEGDKALVDASWRVVAHKIGGEIVAKLKQGDKTLSQEELKKIRENPDSELTAIITLLYVHDRKGLAEEQRHNVGMLINRQLGLIEERDLQKNDSFIHDSLKSLEYYDPIYNGLENAMRAKMKNSLAELKIDINTLTTPQLYRDLMMAATVEAAKDKGIIVGSNGHPKLAGAFDEVVDRWMEDSNSNPNERNNILSLAYDGKASVMMYDFFGIDNMNMKKIKFKEITGHAIGEMTKSERNLISTEQKNTYLDFLNANFEGVDIKIKGDRRSWLRALLMLSMIGLPMGDSLLAIGSFTTPQERQQYNMRE